jgi:uncharacterized RDD family membrane protein YckC
MEAGVTLFCPVCDRYLPNDCGEKASIGSRMGAFILDWAVITMLGVIAFCLLTLTSTFNETGINAALFLLPVSLLLYIVLSVQLLSRGQTPGKWMMDLRVIDKRNGQNPGFAKMIIREFIGKWISGFFFGLGWFWMIWDRDGQAWHDKIAGTVVVHRESHTYRGLIFFLGLSVICLGLVGTVLWRINKSLHPNPTIEQASLPTVREIPTVSESTMGAVPQPSREESSDEVAKTANTNSEYGTQTSVSQREAQVALALTSASIRQGRNHVYTVCGTDSLCILDRDAPGDGFVQQMGSNNLVATQLFGAGFRMLVIKNNNNQSWGGYIDGDHFRPMRPEIPNNVDQTGETAQSSPRTWMPHSDSATWVTGPILMSTTGISIKNIIYPLTLTRPLKGNELESAAQIFHLQSSQDDEGWLFRANISSATRLINDNTLCGTDDAQWLIAVVTPDGPSTTRELHLMFFSGDSEPAIQPGLEKSSKECSSFVYFH